MTVATDSSLEFPGLHDADAPIWASASGDRVIAADGRKYVDLAMGFGSYLWGHGFYSEFEGPAGLGDLQTTTLREHACNVLTESLAPTFGRDDLRAVIFQSGSEAVETALKTALIQSPSRTEVVAFEGSYHGTFGMALAVTHRDDFRAPFAAWLPDCVRFEPYGVVPGLDERVACVIVEPIQGRAGVILPPPEFLGELRTACTEVGALLIVDSVLVGAGRTGTLAGVEIEPDILCLGKALGGGVPAPAVIAPAHIADAWSQFGPEAIHTSTHIAHNLSCAAICGSIKRLNAADLDDDFLPLERAMREIATSTPYEVRGTLALWAIDTGVAGGGVALAQQLQDDGFITAPSGPDGSVLTLTPSKCSSASTYKRFTQAVVHYAT